ncbi:MAG: hypothetical protein ACO23H_10470 [Alphaproteobacteria bacterium]
MTEHPLTDELIEEIARFDPDADDMRAAYDKGAEDRLEQITEWLRKNLPQTLYLEPIGYIEYKKEDRLRLIDDLKKAMRPQGDNND